MKGQKSKNAERVSTLESEIAALKREGKSVVSKEKDLEKAKKKLAESSGKVSHLPKKGVMGMSEGWGGRGGATRKRRKHRGSRKH